MQEKEREKDKERVSVTISELALLQILWEASRPLNRGEIMKKAGTPEDSVFAKNSFYILVNSLVAKNYLITVENSGLGRKNARRFAPTVSRNEFLALQVASTENYQPKDIPEIMSALIEYSSATDTNALLDGMEQLIQQKREQSKREKHSE